MNDVNVVCRQLGYFSASPFPYYAANDQGSEPTWMDDVNCQGRESSLFSCAHAGCGVENCSHSEDANICEKDWLRTNYTFASQFCFMGSSQGKCATQGANLPSIHSQEENVFVQNLHGGEKSWLGLSDINTEGKFVWTDGTSTDFHHWADHQLNNYGNQDCVHTLGFLKVPMK
ncbi:hypothetical protein ACROYT_G030087 [Oculina patagonica]